MTKLWQKSCCLDANEAQTDLVLAECRPAAWGPPSSAAVTETLRLKAEMGIPGGLNEKAVGWLASTRAKERRRAAENERHPEAS